MIQCWIWIPEVDKCDRCTEMLDEHRCLFTLYVWGREGKVETAREVSGLQLLCRVCVRCCMPALSARWAGPVRGGWAVVYRQVGKECLVLRYSVTAGPDWREEEEAWNMEIAAVTWEDESVVQRHASLTPCDIFLAVASGHFYNIFPSTSPPSSFVHILFTHPDVH